MLHDLHQGELSITQYFNILCRHWQHLDMFEIHSWNCPEDTVLYRRIVEQKRTFKFLLGLNKNLDEVRGRIMGTKPLPNLREAFSEVRCEESRKKVMMRPHNSAHIMEGSSLASRGYSNSNYDNRHRKGRPWCDHCNKPGHAKENCWKIYGKPADWKPSKSINDKDRHANNVTLDNNRDKNTILPHKQVLSTRNNLRSYRNSSVKIHCLNQVCQPLVLDLDC